ncbi:MAG: hypothetical protein ABJH04_13980 [Cyclobacteriaceae bacterium]
MRTSNPIIILLLFLGSCSIIKDEDIQSKEDLDAKLRLTRVEISEGTQAFSDINPDGTYVLYGRSFAEASFNSQGQLSALAWSGLSASNASFNSGSKLRVNHKSESADPIDPIEFTNKIDYNSNGYPSRITSVTETDNFEFESFEFTYNSDGNIFSIVTLRKSKDGILNQKTTDVLGYVNNRVSRVDRLIDNLNSMTEKSETIEVTRSGNGVITMIEYTFSNGTIRFYDQQCPNENCFWYFSEIEQPNLGPFGNPNISYNNTALGFLPTQLVDSRTGLNQTFGEDRPPDIFFVHPLLILPHLFKNGVEVSQIFINDWWLVSSIIDPDLNMNQDETVLIDYTFEVP